MTLQDLLELFEYGIKYGSIVAEAAVLSATYLLAIQAGLSPTNALVLNGLASATYHREGVFKFFSNQFNMLKNCYGGAEENDENDENATLGDFRIG